MKQFLSLISMLFATVFPPLISAAALDDKLESLGFVDVSTIDSEIVVSLMYARDDNFVGKTMYTTLTRAYLHPEAAKALQKSQSALKQLHPEYTLKICDAARPMSVQRTMYKAVQGTSKARYVSNPANGGGLHNYGLAVDITIADQHGNELDMGTHVDHLGPEANIDKEQQLVACGVITEQARNNRMLLRKVMAAGGWKPLRSEWWHFNLRSRAIARSRYKRLDF